MALESYRRVVPSFWNDPDVRVLSQPAKLALLYYVTSPHGNMIGLYHCPILYAAREIGMPEADLAELLATDLRPFLAYDAATEEVLVYAMAKHQIEARPKATDKRLTSVRRLVAAAHSPELVSRFLTKYADWNLGIEAPSKPLRSPFEAPSCREEWASYSTGTDAGTDTGAGTRDLDGEFGAWVDPFAVEWERRIGMASKPKLGLLLRPLVERHGVPQVYAAWQGYVREGEGQKWVSPRHFAETYQAVAERWALATDTAGHESPIPDRPGCLALEVA